MQATADKQRGKHQYLAVVSVVILMAVTCALIYVLVTSSISNMFAPQLWTIAEINLALDVPVPADATDVTFDGHQSRGAHIDLTFKASAASVMVYAHAICNTLYPGYDPFDAIDTEAPYSYAKPITLHIYTFRSYSYGTPNTVRGNRCLSPRTRAQHDIRVDAVNAQLYSIRVHTEFSVKIGSRDSDLVYAKDFPMQVWGLVKADDTFELTGSEVCIVVRYLQTCGDDICIWQYNDWQQFANSAVFINVDGETVATSRVGDYGWFVLARELPDEIVAETQQQYFCTALNVGVGLHTLTVAAESATGKRLTSSWQIKSNG